jgi:hypothetical protein
VPCTRSRPQLRVAGTWCGRMPARRDTPARHMVLPFAGRPTYGGACSWFRGPSRAAEATGNPVGVRDCPAAVNGNERHHPALGLISLGSDGQ